MSIEFWIIVWKVVLIGGVGLFAALAVVVSIGGAIDVGKLLRRLREQRDDHQSGANAQQPDDRLSSR